MAEARLSLGGTPSPLAAHVSPGLEQLPTSKQALSEDCPVCAEVTLKAALDGVDGIGALDCCDHLFCHGCLAKWVTEFTNTCPLCNGKAHTLYRRQRVCGQVTRGEER